MARSNYPPLVKKLLGLRDRLLDREGSVVKAMSKLQEWSKADETGSFSTSLAYEAFKPKGQTFMWHKLV